jgi:hypothetical protein
VSDVANNEETTPKLGGITGKGFMPGQSGNLSGRPKKKLIDWALEEELAALDSEEARKIAKALVQLAAKDVAAARLVTERTEGKPIQKLEHSGPDGSPVQGLIRVEFVKA